MSVDGQTDSGYSTTDSVEDWYSLDTMVKHTYHGWKFSKKKIKKICAYAEISIDDELDRMRMLCSWTNVALCPLLLLFIRCYWMEKGGK